MRIICQRTNAMSTISSIQVPRLGPPNVPTTLGPVNTAANRFEKPDFGNQDELREKFTQFVGETFYGQMIKSMRSTVGKPAYFHGGQAERSVSGPARSATRRTSDRSDGRQVRRTDVQPAVSAPGRQGRRQPRRSHANPSINSNTSHGANPMHHEATPTTDATRFAWKSDIAGLLSELSAVQTRSARTCSRTSARCSPPATARRSAARSPRSRIWSRGCKHARSGGSGCCSKRPSEGLPSDSIQLAEQVAARRTPQTPARRARRSRNSARAFLQHECLTNWVLVQRTLLHLSQLIEIIATGGRMKPTYGNGSDRQDQGALVDRAV